MGGGAKYLKWTPVTALALKLAPLVFVRPAELLAAECSEFDLRFGRDGLAQKR